MTNFKDKERGEETVHFRKADEELLRKLLQKVNAPHLLCRYWSPPLHCVVFKFLIPLSRLSHMLAGRQCDLSMQVKAQADSADSTQAQESAKSELQSLKARFTARI